MPFVAEWGWHVKNSQTSHIFLEWMYPLSRFRMSLLFLISGFVSAASLNSKTAASWLQARLSRLLIPLAVGVAVVVPPQIYLERRFTGTLAEPGYLSFWLNSFTTGPYPAGDVSWHHLWYLAYLAAFTVIFLPALIVIARSKFEFNENSWLGRSGACILAVFIPVAIVQVLLRPYSSGLQNFIDDAAMLATYSAYFVFGAALYRWNKIGEWLTQHRVTFLQTAILLLLIIDYLRWNGLEPSVEQPGRRALFDSAVALFGWSVVVAALGYARIHLNRRPPALKHLTDGVFPVYVLHQTITVILSYCVSSLAESVELKFVFVFTGTLSLSIAIYYAFIRPYPIMCRLFGGPAAKGQERESRDAAATKAA